jgi:polyisoprenoid-binding protein YceI
MTRLLARPLTPGRWEVQNTLSCARFAVRNLGVRTVRGSVAIRAASVDVDEHGWPTSVDATLDLSRIDTANARRDRDLAKPQLLDTGRHPALVFHGYRVETDEGGWKVTGTLVAHGAETDVLLDVRVVGGDRADEDQVAVRASTSFDRRELGIRAPRLMIGRPITVTIDAVLRRPEGSGN